MVMKSILQQLLPCEVGQEISGILLSEPRTNDLGVPESVGRSQLSFHIRTLRNLVERAVCLIVGEKKWSFSDNPHKGIVGIL